MKTAISLPDELFEAADELARQLDITRSELYATAVLAYVQAHRAADVTAALDRVYQDQPSALDPGLSRLQAAALPHDEW